jgi:regulator of RNase E activity RraA
MIETKQFGDQMKALGFDFYSGVPCSFLKALINYAINECDYVMAANEGDVIVVEHRGRTDVSGWGGLLSRGAKNKGVAAVIIDGACRDIDESRELGLPVFARAAVPVTARGRIAEHDYNCPITMGAVAVYPGDWLVADGSGVVFIPAAHLDDVIATAERILARETLMARDIDGGVSIGEVMGADYEDMLKKNG